MVSRKRKPSDIVQLKIRMPEALRAQLEEDAERHGGSINAESVRRLERSFDRQHLLPEAMELAYGTRLAGLLLLMGGAMATAVRYAGTEPTTDETWPFAAEALAAAQAVVRKVFAWAPTHQQGSLDGVFEQTEEHAATALKWHLRALENARAKPDVAGTLKAATVEKLGPLLDAMIDSGRQSNTDKISKRRA